MKRFRLIFTCLVLVLGTMSINGYAGNGNNGNNGNHGNGNNGNGNGNDGNNGNSGGGNSSDGEEGTGDCEFNEDDVLYDLSGTLISFVGNPNNSNSATKFIFETESGESYLVKTAPAWYLNLQSVVLEVDDELIITGFTCVEEDDGEEEVSLMAMWIVKGEDLLELRSDTGHPLWSALGNFSGCSNNISKYPAFEYIMANEETDPLSGTILVVDIDCLSSGDYAGYLLTLKLEDESEVLVVLAPYWYLSHQFFELEEGISVSITGMFYTMEDDSVVFVARQIELEDKMIILRDAEGNPFWQAVRIK